MKPMRTAFVIAVTVFITQYGCICCIGTPSRAPVSITTIPNTQVKVLLHGPGKRGEYSGVVVFKNAWTPRELGRLQPNQTTPARLEDLGDGIYRVRWGDAQSGPYVIIDTKKELIVEDSNGANPKNQPFNKPEF